ncbi:F-box protein At5g18160-like [Triticum dicoccoides]|uniref:F-box protein At5g18160-like n=1 Tax=Triticum dicoccoides TaxID=85692 RepID=UPI000E7C097E|nr:F-box protein At5g18160-like [Triticum dicoccoides]
MPDSGGATVLDDLPEWIVVEEILIRLPPKDILRCRAVRRWWHNATSTDKFMLENHRHQPFLPILSLVVELHKTCLLFSFDAGAGQQKLCPVVQTCDYGELEAACDGLLIVSHGSMADKFICNPVTRKCAPLAKPQAQRGFDHQIVGFYRHQPSGGEFRVLWISRPTKIYNPYDANYRTFYYVIAVGCDNTRCIRQGCIPQPTSSSHSLELALRRGLPGSSQYPPVHHRGGLHWRLRRYHGWDADYIMVFNTSAETFRLMSRPAGLSNCLQESLLEMNDTLALCSISSDKRTVDVWVLQDYDVKTWSFKHRINLTGVDPSALVYPEVIMSPRMAALNEGVLLVQFTCRRVLHFDIDGKFLGYVKSKDDQEIDLWVTKHYLQGSVIPLPLSHEMREEDSENQEPPFFVGL